MPFFKRKKKEKKVIEISPPLPTRDDSPSVPTSSIGTQAQFSPPNTPLQTSNTVGGTAAGYSLVEDPGYSVVHDALPQRLVKKKVIKKESPKPTQSHSLSDNLPEHLQRSNVSLASVTPINSESEESDVSELNEASQKAFHGKPNSSAYAVVKKTAKSISFSDTAQAKHIKKSSPKNVKVQSHNKHSKEKKHKVLKQARDGAAYYSFVHADQPNHDVDDNEESQDYTSASDEELEVTPPIALTLPSHRPPCGSQSPDRSRPSPVQSSPKPINTPPLQSWDSLPVYTLNNNNSASSNDQSYILTKMRPDGSVNYYTATPVSPNYSVDGLSTSPPRLPQTSVLQQPISVPSLQPVSVLPGATSTPIKGTDHLASTSQPPKLTGLPHSLPIEIHAQPNAAMQQAPPHIQHYPGLYDMGRSETHSTSPVQSKFAKPSFSDSEMIHMNKPGQVDSLHKELQAIKSERAKLETENTSLKKLHDSIHLKAGKKAEEHKKEMSALLQENELLKESIAKLSSEISTHSLVDQHDDNDAELPVEQLLESVPARLRSVMTTFNETIAEKENLIKSFEVELSQLKRETKSTKLDKIKLERSYSKEKELSEVERQALHQNLSEVREQNTSFQGRIVSLLGQLKQLKKDHKHKVEKLTDELAGIKTERDAVRHELKSLQHHRQEVDTILKSYKLERAENSISMDEHIQTIKDFENLLEEVKHGAKYNKQVEVKALERENSSLLQELAELRGSIAAVKEECSYLHGVNKNYEKWISKLMLDIRAAHDREGHLTEQLKSSFSEGNHSFSISPNRQTRLKTAMEVAKRELELEEISKKLENYKAHLALQKIRTKKL